ncbi:MAG: ATP-binding protein [Caldilineaceae bacterium]|nr:ATP-binding protein [Caldilineaceae bacterium]
MVNKNNSANSVALQKSLLELLEEREASGKVTTSVLRTDDRVLARISDGIYRHPSSALRELIANAYDADATTVHVRTDAPRFREISIRDDGHGMDKASLVHLVEHIGGSAKRTRTGSDLGITNQQNPSLSPKGRKLIGKIGIGLFSVAQLTRQFRIITKRAGDKYRLVADVVLRTYSEDGLADSPMSDNVVTGEIKIRSVEAADITSHGTEIILLNIQPPAVDMLQSRELWERVIEDDDEYRVKVEPPSYHIGCVRKDNAQDMFRVPPSLPWDQGDSPEEKSHLLFSKMLEESNRTTAKPKLATTYDEYLRTLWNLGLSLPVPYVEGSHPFDLEADAMPRFYLLSNEPKGQATPIDLDTNQSLREKLDLKAPFRQPDDKFEVFIDNIKIQKPISFVSFPEASRDDDRKRPILFIGHYKAPLEKLPENIIGGRELEFEAYFLWTPKIVPTEHAGVMVRIADASGTRFDETFFSYQVQELRRLNQTTAEIFVRSGLDAALNIDRESFNFGHPHAKIVSSWVHRALRQIANTQKRLAQKERDKERQETAALQASNLQKLVERRIEQIAGRDPKPVKILDSVDNDVAIRNRATGNIVITKESIQPAIPQDQGVQQQQNQKLMTEKMKSIVQILEAFGVLDDLTYEKRELLIATIAEILGEGK